MLRDGQLRHARYTPEFMVTFPPGKFPALSFAAAAISRDRGPPILILAAPAQYQQDFPGMPEKPGARSTLKKTFGVLWGFYSRNYKNQCAKSSGDFTQCAFAIEVGFCARSAPFIRIQVLFSWISSGIYWGNMGVNPS